MNFLGLTPTPAPHTWQGRGGGRFSVTPTPVSVSKIDYDSDCDSGHSCRLQPIPTSASTPTPTPQPCIFINLKASVVARALWKVKGAQIIFLKYSVFERPIVKVFQKDIDYKISYQRWGKGVGGLDVSCVFRRYWVKKKRQRRAKPSSPHLLMQVSRTYCESFKPMPLKVRSPGRSRKVTSPQKKIKMLVIATLTERSPWNFERLIRAMCIKF